MGWCSRAKSQERRPEKSRRVPRTSKTVEHPAKLPMRWKALEAIQLGSNKAPLAVGLIVPKIEARCSWTQERLGQYHRMRSD